MLERLKRAWAVPLLLLASVIGLTACSSRLVYEIMPSQATDENAVNINSATAEELQTLPFVGRKTAESIVIFREQNGPFRRSEHLMLIPGMSEKRFNEIRHLVKIH
jgi:competence ComEA-like helix-hairpin-helix protein